MEQAAATPGSGRQALRQLLAQHPAVDGICCSSGLGGQPFAAGLKPALTTVRVDGARVGRAAALRVVDRMAGTPASGLARRDKGVVFVERRST